VPEKKLHIPWRLRQDGRKKNSERVFTETKLQPEKKIKGLKKKAKGRTTQKHAQSVGVSIFRTGGGGVGPGKLSTRLTSAKKKANSGSFRRKKEKEKSKKPFIYRGEIKTSGSGLENSSSDYGGKSGEQRRPGLTK